MLINDDGIANFFSTYNKALYTLNLYYFKF